ncbi:PAS domain-containing sensor histidine kinase [uncultured Brevundimonas sp.]|uniref:two-component system sensor histidine kinase NtrB n=1 Tax=uncultured Brevundimonas sp. TaxID=213418 RepID=UPI0026322BC0|nr:PAS domain-containing sensor histidine kinase [uncultured Brevundimonas sp.]
MLSAVTVTVLLVAAALVQFLPVNTAFQIALPPTASLVAGHLLRWRLASALTIALAILILAATLAGTADAISAAVTTSSMALVMLVQYGEYFRRSGPYKLYRTTEHEVLEALLDAVPVVLLDRAGRVCRASLACEALFGYEREEIIGMAFGELVQDFDPLRHAGRDIPSGTLPHEGGDWQARTAQQTRVPIDLWLNHTVEGPLIRLTDLTPRHAADAQARELHSQLNKVWRLNSLGEMAATLAHELNQPLGAAAAYLHAAQEDMKSAGILGESAFRTAELAKNQMLRAGQIIRRMRELLTMEMRALARERVSEVIDDVLPILTLTGRDRSVTIGTAIAVPDLVRMDRIQIQQALVNLVRNAVEACPNGGQVMIVGQILNDRAYEIAVEDSGPGIEPDQIERVFQPMTTTKSGGMGLGLSVTRTIVESHGGHLSVGRSKLGGARFSFTLKIATPKEDA